MLLKCYFPINQNNYDIPYHTYYLFTTLIRIVVENYTQMPDVIFLNVKHNVVVAHHVTCDQTLWRIQSQRMTTPSMT